MSNNTKQVKGLQLFFLNLTKGNKDKSIKNKSKINYPPDTEEIINIDSIIVTDEFRHSYPSPKKIIEYTSRFEQNGMIDKAIVIRKEIVFDKEKYILVDGYIRYLILKQSGIDEVPVRFEKWIHKIY